MHMFAMCNIVVLYLWMHLFASEESAVISTARKVTIAQCHDR